MPTISFQQFGAIAHLSSPGFYPLYNPYDVYCTVPAAQLKIASSIISWAAISSSIPV